MVQINFSLKEVNCKIVYYGPGLSGKTTNLEVVHKKAPVASVGELTSIATEGDRTLFFDFLPLNLGHVAGMKTKFQIYTVPGQVYYNSTRKLVLQGADGIVFVADSKKGKMQENVESLQNLAENLREYGMDINTTPIVLQYNKRDLPDVHSIEELNKTLNRWDAPHFEAVARDGVGVFPTLKHLAGMVLESLNRQHGVTTARSAPAKVATKQRVAVAVGGGGAVEEAVAAAPTATGNARRGGTVVRTRSQAVPAATATSTQRPRGAAVRPAAAAPVGGPAAAARKNAASRTGHGRTMLVVGGVVLMLGAIATYLYMSGLWKKLLP